MTAGFVQAAVSFMFPFFFRSFLRTQGSQRQRDFGFAKSKTLPGQCRECPHLNLCWGECPKNRLIRAPDGEIGLNYLCPGLKRFFTHAEPTLRGIAKEIAKGEER